MREGKLFNELRRKRFFPVPEPPPQHEQAAILYAEFLLLKVLAE